MIDVTSFAPPIIPAVITGVLSAWLTAALAFSRTKKEKVWDARFASYQQILSNLHDMGVGFDNMFEATIRRKDISADDKVLFREKYMSGRKSLEQFIYTSDLLLDHRVRPRIERLFLDVENAQGTTDWSTYLDGSSGTIWNCSRDITTIARRHLEI